MGVNFTFESRAYMKSETIQLLKKYWLKDFANPMSSYQFGARARYMMELSRDRIAKFIGVDQEEIYFIASRKEALTWIEVINSELSLHWPLSQLNDKTKDSLNGIILDIEGGLHHLPIHDNLEKVIFWGSFREIGGPKDGYFIRIPSNLKGVALIHGGHQERARRAGTQNLPSIVAMENVLRLFQQNKDEFVSRWEFNLNLILTCFPTFLNYEATLAYIDIFLKNNQIHKCEEKLIREDIICDFTENSLRLWVPYELKEEELVYVKQVIQIVEEFYE